MFGVGCVVLSRTRENFLQLTFISIGVEFVLECFFQTKNYSWRFLACSGHSICPRYQENQLTSTSMMVSRGDHRFRIESTSLRDMKASRESLRKPKFERRIRRFMGICLLWSASFNCGSSDRRIICMISIKCEYVDSRIRYLYSALNVMDIYCKNSCLSGSIEPTPRPEGCMGALDIFNEPARAACRMH